MPTQKQPTIKHKVIQIWQNNEQLGLAEYYEMNSNEKGEPVAQFKGLLDDKGHLFQATLLTTGYYDTFKLDAAGKPVPTQLESGRLLAAKTQQPCLVQETSYDANAKPLPDPIVQNVLFQLPK